MLMAKETFRNLAAGQLKLKPLTGVTQRSGVKSGAERWDLSSTCNAPA
jgi:hypothetical protein